MIKLSKDEALIVLQLLSRVQIQGNEAPTFVAVVQTITSQIEAEDTDGED